MKGSLIGIGVGPGDPELLTIKAVKAIQKADLIIAPCSRVEEDSIALNIVKEYINTTTEIRKMIFPMISCREALMQCWQENTNEIIQELDKGKVIVFLTLGDLMLYSTYMYINKLLLKGGYQVVSVPGITSFSAIASHLNIPLAEGDEPLLIFPFGKNTTILEAAIEKGVEAVVMKASQNPLALASIIEENSLENNFVMVSKCGQREERVSYDIEDLKKGKIPYLSTVVIKSKPIDRKGEGLDV